MTNLNDIILTLKVKADGDDELRPVVAALESLVSASDDVKRRTAGIFDELASSEKAGRAVDQFRATARAVLDLSKQITESRGKVAELGKELSAIESPTKRQEAAFEKARSSLARLEAQEERQRAKLAELRTALEAQGLATNNLVAAEKTLQQRKQAALAALQGEARAYAASRVEAERLAASKREEEHAALRTVKANTSAAIALQDLRAKQAQARAGSDDLTASVDRTGSAFGRLKTFAIGALASIAGFVGLRQLKDGLLDIISTGERFDDLEKKIATAFGGIDVGREKMAQFIAFAKDVPNSLDEVVDAAIALRKNGFDPLDGTLKALIDNQQALDQSNDQLLGTIETLGKAYTRNELSLKTIVSLTQQGIPVFDLLSKATGKSEEALRAMAESGRLGRDAIRALVGALGELRDGAAIDELGDTDAMLTKLKDSAREFLNTIADAGVLDYFRGKLSDLLAYIKQAARNGDLQALAKSISDGIISTANGIGSAIKFVADYSSTLLTLAKAYVIVKAATAAADLAGGAAKFLKLATGAQSAADAVGAIAGKTGVLQAAFSKLPKSVQIGVAAAGLEFTLSQVLDLIDALGDLADQNNRNAIQEDQIAVQREVLLKRAKAIAADLTSAQDTQVLSAGVLATKSRDQAEAYLAQLQAAQRYYQAIKVIDDAIGDAAGATAAREKLKQLGDAVQAASSYIQEIDEGLRSAGEEAVFAAAHFDELRNKGKNAAEAIAGAFDHVEIKEPRGLQDVVDVLEQMRARGRAAGEAVESELTAKLAALNDVDLREFQQRVTDALAEPGKHATALRVALEASLQASLQKIGLTAEQSGAQITETGRKLITTFGDIADNAAATGEQVQLAFAKALSQAQTEAEVRALGDKLEQAFQRGVVSSGQYQVSLEAVGRKLAQLKADSAIAAASLDGIGEAGQDAAYRTVAAFESARGELVAKASQISGAIASALAGGADQNSQQVAAMKAQLAETEAGIAALSQRQAEFQGVADQANAAASQGLQQVQQHADQAGEAIQQTGTKAQEAGEKATVSLTGAAGAVSGIRAAFAATSEEAGRFFDNMVYLDGIKFSAVSTGDAFDSMANRITRAVQATQSAIDQQRATLNASVDSLRSFAAGSASAFDGSAVHVEQMAAQLDVLQQQIADGAQQFNLLGQEDLGRLQSALEEARSRVEALQHQAEAAKSRLSELGDELQDQIDQINGNQSNIETRRYQEQLEQIAQLEMQGGEAAAAEAEARRKQAEELHQLKLRQIAEQAAAQKQADDQAALRERAQADAASATSKGGSGGVSRTAVDLNLNLNGAGGAFGLDLSKLSVQQKDAFARELGPSIIAWLKRQKQLAGA